MTATFQIVRELGWGYLEKLAKQRVMQVQSSTDTPKKIAPASARDGRWQRYNLIQLKEQGQPGEIIYPTEGTPLITGPSALFKAAPIRRGAPFPELAELPWIPAAAGRLCAHPFRARAGPAKARQQNAQGNRNAQGRSAWRRKER